MSAGPYSVVYADPPWSFKVRSPKGEGRSASRHYPTLSLADIKALPVGALGAKDSVLLLWTTDPFLEQAFEVVRAWGYKYSTVGFYWVKTNGPVESCADGKGRIIVGGFHMGTGYHTRANPEPCLLATRGRGLPRLSRSVRKLVVAPVREHSRKPCEVRERIRRLYAGPHVECFARERAEGFDVALSDEPEKFGAAA